MKLAYINTPVKDFDEALAFYRDTLGLDELWREGSEAAGFKLPDSAIGLMIDRDDREEAAGPFFVIDSVDEFYAARSAELKFLGEPRDIPPGRYASFADPSGNVIRVMDRSRERD